MNVKNTRLKSFGCRKGTSDWFAVVFLHYLFTCLHLIAATLLICVHLPTSCILVGLACSSHMHYVTHTFVNYLPPGVRP